MRVEISFDPAKNERNIRERGLDFRRARDLDETTAVSGPVFRNGEWRTQAIGYLDDRLHILLFKKTERGMRVISFRRANEREAKKYGLKIRR